MFDVRHGNETQFEVCKAAVKRLKMLRHPSILTYLESLEVFNDVLQNRDYWSIKILID